MTQCVEKNTPKKLSLRKNTLELFVSATAQGVINAKERIKQKKETILHKLPLLEKIDRKIKAFDKLMERKHGQVYLKLRDSAKNITRTVVAAHLFGIPGVIGMCAYKTCEKTISLLEPAQKAKQKGETRCVLDYLAKNKNEANFTLTSGALSIASATCDVIGAYAAKGVIRVGKASLLITPEVKKFVQTTGKWFQGRESFVEVKRDAAVMGITFGTYFISEVPMTRGSKKQEDNNQSNNLMNDTLPQKSPQQKVQDCFHNLQKVFETGLHFNKAEKKDDQNKKKTTSKSDDTETCKQVNVLDVKNRKGGR